MRLAYLTPLFVFVCVLTAVCAVALRVNLPWVWFSYLAAMVLSHIAALLLLSKTGHGYMSFYAGASILTVTLMLVAAGDFTRNMPEWMTALLAIGSWGFCMVVMATLRYFLLRVYHRFPGECEIEMLHCAALSVAGAWALASYMAEQSALGQIIRSTLGVYWCSRAVSGFVVTAGAAKFHATGAKLAIFLPAVVGIVCFGWLAWRLGHLEMQPVAELAREAVRA